MEIEFVDLKRQNKLYKKELLKAIEDIVGKATFIMEEPLERFETSFARFCAKKYCLGVNSGTDALMLALLAYGIGPADEVITVPNSYFSTAMVVSNIGAKPIFVDIHPQSFTIDTQQIEAKITKKTKAIIPVHLFGQPVDMDPIVQLAKKYSLKIVEDCCQAHGAKYKAKRIPYTETGVFSFYPGKNLGAFGDAGALVTDNPKIKEKVAYLRNDGSIRKYEHQIFGYKSRLDALQAAVLNLKLKHLNVWNKRRRQSAKLYHQYLGGIKQIRLLREMDYAYHVYHLYVIECPKRNQLQQYLTKAGITTIIHYPTPIHLQKPYLAQGFKKGDFPITEAKAKKILSLPMFPELKEEEVKYICYQIKAFYSNPRGSNRF